MRTRYRASAKGFTLLELMISMSILVVVSLLTFVVTQSSTSAAAVAGAKEMAQAAVRDAMTDMARELATASKRTNNALVPPLQALTVVSPTEIVFQVPLDSTGTRYSAPIRYTFTNEDTGAHGGASNGRLDSGEDTNEDSILTRRIVRTQGDAERVLGATNDISGVQFALNPPANDTLTITLMASKAVDNARHNLISATATSRVYLTN